MYRVNGVLEAEWWTDGRSSLQGRRRADFSYWRIQIDSPVAQTARQCEEVIFRMVVAGLKRNVGIRNLEEGVDFYCCRATLREDTSSDRANP